jgi:RNA polymerase sigma-70 factor (ECF subfamily)
MNSTTNETEMIQAAQHGDLNAFNSLILQYQDFLFRVALRLMQDEDQACDAIQEACILAFRKIDSFRGGSFHNWLARIVVNVCYDELRLRKRRPVQSLDSTGPADDDSLSPYWLADYSTNPEMNFEANEFGQAIKNCLELLSPRHRMVLVLIDMEEMSYEEAAGVLAIPVGTVKSRLARARIQMRNILQASTLMLTIQSRNVSVSLHI